MATKRMRCERACLLTAVALLGLPAASAVAQSSSAIYVMRVDGSQVRKVAEAPGFNGVGHARWSHDGKRLAFHGWEGPNDSRQIFVVDADAVATQTPDVGPPGQVPDWSPDDKQLAFQTPRDGANRIRSWAANLDDKGRTLLAEGASPRWSPDGGRLAFSDGGNLIVRDLLSEEDENLTDPLWQGFREGFAWSPDGRSIACVARREGVLGLWIVDTQNRTARQRLQADLLGHVAWSPDGKRLAVTLGGQIQLLDVDGDSQPRPIPGQVGGNRDPAWSPDGKWIAFSSDRGAEGP